jgi:pectate lyase
MKKLTFLKTAIVISLFCFTSSTRSLAANSWVYVDVNAVGNNDGSSWANACNFLQDALNNSSYAQVILVARGTYCPDRTSSVPNGSGSRYASFYLNNSQAIYGGFAGHGAPDPNARDVKLYETILSGDLDGNDIYVDDPANLRTEPTRAENSYNVLYSHYNDASAIIDGFTITGGNANTSDIWPTSNGGGMHNDNSFCIIKNCTFRENSAEYGGAMYTDIYSGPKMINCIFFRNSSQWDGGVMVNERSSPVLVNCIFTSNKGSSGSILNYGQSSPKIINCLFNHNSTTYGGGIYNRDSSTPTITNCTFCGNAASEYGGGIYNTTGGNVTIANCIFWGNTTQIENASNSTVTVNYSDIQDGWTGTGNINANPRFVNANGLDGVSGTLDDDLRLLPGSPCIDKGNNSSVPADIADLDGDDNITEQTPLDLGNNPRFADGDCNSTVIVDMGAYESIADDHAAPTPNPMIFETAPYATSDSSVTMVATTAMDISGIEYYFANITDPNHNSGWQDSTTYTDTGLLPFTIYTYTVKARDKSCSHNETAASNPASTSALMVNPSQGFVSGGYEGGPFTPVSKNYTLMNNSLNALDWTAEANVPWLNVSPGSGTLASGQSTVVTVSINADANSLAAGYYHTEVKFTNLTSDNNQVRPVTLMVQAIDGPIGWVTMSDGNVPYNITGGSAGDTVTVTDANSLKAYATSTLPYVILVSGTITMPRGTSSSNHPQTVNLQSNKTIIGIGSNPGINGGFSISGQSNVIVRNLNIWYEDSLAQGSADPWTDGITVQNGSQHIWIDHCSIFDSPDGLIDPTMQSNYITISWCKFYYTENGENTAHRNCCLVGSDDGTTADRGKLKETFHHNWWSNGCKERMPRVRFGKVHVFNNYYSGLQSGGYCQGVGVESQIRVENNYYDAVPNTWKNYSQAGIQGIIGWNSGNVFYNCIIPTWAPNDYDNIFVPPYFYTLDAGADVKNIVMGGAGANPDGDLTPPTPNPMTFATAPYAVSYTSIAMVATTATDDVHGVEYYFTCTTDGGHSSGWQDSNTYTATNLLPSTTYTFTVKARDKSACQNETAASAPASATTLVDIFVPTPDPMTFATAPYAINDLSISMVATTATDASGVEYYFTCTAGIGHDSGWQNSPTYTDTGLTENSTCTYTVKARDKSTAHNQTADSNAASATTLPDTSPPTPNPMTFDVGPYAIDPHSISMTATTAIDGSGVEYLFTCIAGGGHSSTWQNSTTYTDTGLAEGSTYSYTVTARDKSPLHHTTAPSNPETETTPLDTTAPTPNPMTWATNPYVATSSLSITMVAITATDNFGGVEYYFANVTDSNHNSGWQDSTTYTDTGLTNKKTYSYKVKARDKSFNHNETAWSSEVNATARYVCSGTIGSDLNKDCEVDFVDFALMASHWNEAPPPAVDLVVNGTFDDYYTYGWGWLNLPTATGSCWSGWDTEYGNPPSAGYVMCDTSLGYVDGYYFYQMIPVTPGNLYRFSGDWFGDLTGGASDPCSSSNWTDVIITFETTSDPNTWTLANPDKVMYRKAWGITRQNVDGNGLWNWESIKTSPVNGPVDGTFISTGNYMVVAFSISGIEGPGSPWIEVDNIKVEDLGCSPADLNGDCHVNLLDLSEFASDWLTCNRVPVEDCWQ